MGGLIDRLDGGCVVFTRRIAFLGVLGMLVISMGTISDVLLRWLFNAPIVGFNEVIEVGIAVAIAATFPAGVAQRVNLNIDVLATWFGARATRWLNCGGALALLLFYFFLAWQVAVLASEMAERGATTVFLEIPQAPFVWAVAVLLTVSALAQAVAVLASLRDALGGADPFEASGFSLFSESEAASERKPVVGVANSVMAWSAVATAVVVTAGVFAAHRGVLAFADAAQSVPGTVALILFGLMWVLVLVLVPLGAAMGLIGLLGTALLTGVEPALAVIGSEAVSFVTNHQLAVLPLFLMMGSFAAAAGLSGDIYTLAHTVFGHRRGGLALATIGGCAGFGALTGSSLATAATIGQVALPEMRERGYSAGLATGCVAAGGTLGQLVPPSTAIILYAILTEESIGQLFIAAVVPAALAVVLYWATIALYVRAYPDAAPAIGQRAKLAEIGRAIGRSWGVLLLFGLVIGGLYGGIFTATEAASVGAVGAFVFAWARGKLSGGRLWRVMGETTRTTAMIYILIFGAVTFSFFMGITGLPELMITFVQSFDLGPLAVIGILLVIYIILGSIMDPFPVMVITVPIVTPLITTLGYDLVWWGIIMVCVVETGLITPPFGINVFVLKGIVGTEVPMWTIFRGVMPFVGADLVKLALLTIFPVITLWLPSTMIN